MPPRSGRTGSAFGGGCVLASLTSARASRPASRSQSQYRCRALAHSHHILRTTDPVTGKVTTKYVKRGTTQEVGLQPTFHLMSEAQGTSSRRRRRAEANDSAQRVDPMNPRRRPCAGSVLTEVAGDRERRRRAGAAPSSSLSRARSRTRYRLRQNRDRSGRWPRGTSGNPGGRPRSLAKATRALVGEDGMALAQLWWDIARDETRRDRDRLEASKLLADRGWGKAAVSPSRRATRSIGATWRLLRRSSGPRFSALLISGRRPRAARGWSSTRT
jgi:hypothetical protein